MHPTPLDEGHYGHSFADSGKKYQLRYIPRDARRAIPLLKDTDTYRARKVFSSRDPRLCKTSVALPSTSATFVLCQEKGNSLRFMNDDKKDNDFARENQFSI